MSDEEAQLEGEQGDWLSSRRRGSTSLFLLAEGTQAQKAGIIA
jgi:hypothetical protein